MSGYCSEVGRLVSSVISDVQSFHGQEIYSNIGAAVAVRNGKAKLVMRAVNVGSRFFGVNIIFVVAGILFLRYFRLPDRTGTVFQYGISRNNEIAFERLNACLAHNNDVRVVKNGRHPVLRERFKAIVFFKLIAVSAKILSEKSHSNPFVHVQSIMAASACVFYSANPLPACFRVLCVANDHAPIPLALINIFRMKGGRTLYVQHAPVTEYFPVLSADLSILYDDKSVEAYRKASERRGRAFDSKVVLMPPFEKSFVAPSSTSSIKSVVGVCLSKFPNLVALSDLLSSLSSSSHVALIILRPHPGNRINFSSLLAGRKVVLQKCGVSLSEYSSGVSLALVPTSGVAVELLHEGVPTFYTPGLDDVPYDYYSFVADGILPIFDVDEFLEKGVNVNFFDAGWKQRFSRYDVTVKKTIQDCRDEVAEAFAGLL